MDETISYYEETQPGLGWELAAEVHAAIERIVDHPKAWSTLSLHRREYLIRRFRFGITHHTTQSEIIIIARMHPNRRPGYYLARQD